MTEHRPAGNPATRIVTQHNAPIVPTGPAPGVPVAAGPVEAGPVEIEAVKVLIAHGRTRVEGCRCGWGMDGSKLGQSHALHVWRELQRAALPVRSGYVRDGETPCGEPHPGGGTPCQRYPNHRSHARPASGGWDAWTSEPDKLLDEAQAEVERLRMELETKSVVHQCCEDVQTLRARVAELEETRND